MVFIRLIRPLKIWTSKKIRLCLFITAVLCCLNLVFVFFQISPSPIFVLKRSWEKELTSSDNAFQCPRCNVTKLLRDFYMQIKDSKGVELHRQLMKYGVEPVSPTSIKSQDITLQELSVSPKKTTPILNYNTPVVSHFKTPLLTKTKCDKKYKLLIMATTTPESSTRRSNIRRTWASNWHNRSDLPKWKTVFQLGQSGNLKVRKDVEKESQRFQDMIMGNFTDTFYNLPVKVIMAFEWAFSFCQFDYLLKSDDDVFLHIPNIFQYLSRASVPKTRLYAGNVHTGGKGNSLDPHRHGGKYYVSFEEYPNKTYPRYCSGGGMIFSRDVVGDMIRAHDEHKYFKLEDGYIGMLALKIGVEPAHDPWFNAHTSEKNCKCEARDIIRHGAHEYKCMSRLYQCHRGK